MSRCRARVRSPISAQKRRRASFSIINGSDLSRVRVPFGIAQIGKAFRNGQPAQLHLPFAGNSSRWNSNGSATPTKQKCGAISGSPSASASGNPWASLVNLQMRDHDSDELSHYAKAGLGTADIEYRFPFTAPGYGELGGNRRPLRLRPDAASGTFRRKAGIYGPDRFENPLMPRRIERRRASPAAFSPRLRRIDTVDEKRPSGLYLNFHPFFTAPKKAAILPLTAKDEHVPLAQKLYLDIREDFAVDLDIKQNIGKRYARQGHEIGRPFVFTVHNETPERPQRHRP